MGLRQLDALRRIPLFCRCVRFNQRDSDFSLMWIASVLPTIRSDHAGSQKRYPASYNTDPSTPRP